MDLLKNEICKNKIMSRELITQRIFHIIDNQPTADVAEVVHGKWVYNTDDFMPKYRCSVCGYNKPIVSGENITQEPKNYCPNCGAKMDKK